MSLTRKTPLRRKKPWHPRRTKLTNSAPIKAVSRKRAGQLREYYDVKAEWMRSRHREGKAFCESCGSRENLTLHHYFGRVGHLLHYTPGFRLLCFTCHNAVHEHPAWAREKGLLAPTAEWNVGPKVDSMVQVYHTGPNEKEDLGGG